ncbi:MAG: DsbA family protein [Geminicoccaceae bacterium]
MAVELIYFANPMCSWCWGFAPVITKISDTFADKINLTLALGSLREDEDPMTDEQKAYVGGHWRHVTERTGQPFDFAFFDREAFVYDDRPPSLAIVAARTLDQKRVLPFFHALQRAFYEHNRDITDRDELSTIAVECGLPEAEFRKRFDEPDHGDAIVEEFRSTAAMGVRGYPTLIGLRDGRAEALSIGYAPYEQVADRLAGLIETPAVAAH